VFELCINKIKDIAPSAQGMQMKSVAGCKKKSFSISKQTILTPQCNKISWKGGKIATALSLIKADKKQ